MNRQDAQAEQVQCYHSAEGARKRAMRLEAQGHNLAADEAWRNSVYWTAQATRQNVIDALRNHS